MRKFLLAWLFLLLTNQLVLAQSTPGFVTGQVPTAAQWNSYFAAKQDVLSGLPLPLAGGTLSGRVVTATTTALAAGINLPHGIVPSLPVNGDVWTTTAGMFAQINGSTIGPFSAGAGGTLAVGSGGTGQTTFTANLPLIGNGASAITQGTRSGNTTSFATTSGAMTSGNCVSIDGSGNLVAAGGACTTGGGGGTVASSTIGQVAVYSAATTVTGITACNNGYYGTDGAGAVLCRTSVNTTLSATITALGTVATGVWQGTTIAAQFGGTGVNNGASTITIGGNVVFSGAFTFTATLSATTTPTFPSGTYTVANQTGTSGGIPYYSSATTQASSGALGANLPVFGGGAGSSPIAGTRSGNTTQVVTTTGAQTSGNCVSIDASGNHIASGSACGGAGGTLLNTLTASNSATIQDTTSLTATYDRYDLVFEYILPVTNGTNCRIQLSVDGGSTYKSTGYTGASYVGTGTVTADSTFIPCSFSSATDVGSAATGAGVSGTITIYKPSNATIVKSWIGKFSYIGTGGSFIYRVVNSGGSWSADILAINAVQISFSSGNISSGTVKIYGIN